jgi:hypothetical protein
MIVACLVLLTLLAGMVLFFARDDPKEREETAKLVFGAVLPLLGTWVGTVLAYYFSRESLAAATDSVERVADRLTGVERLRSLPVTTKMRPLANIRLLRITREQAGDTKLSYLLDQFANVERMVIVDRQNVMIYLVYRALADKFLSRFATPPSEALPAGVASAADLTLAHLLAENDDWKWMCTSCFGFVAASATMADAKAAMDAIDRCSDVFVTQNGRADEPLLGWITDNLINRNAVV